VVVAHGPDCPFEVEAPIMLHRWDQLTFLHWSFDPPAVQRLLPAWLEVETFEDRAWVGLVPFFMRVTTPADRGVPWASSFCETNVRTYVRDGEGRTGIWFFSLDAARFGAVAVARATYRLPYFWSDMELDAEPDAIRYDCRRRWPGPRGAVSRVQLGLGAPFEPAELTERDHYLTARWTMFASSGDWRRFARAWHEPWVLRRAEVVDLHDELVPAAGLPEPVDAPLVHHSAGVKVRIGRPERCA
jgi:uncharacterized protein YqjF (DUF2071 family)